MSRMAPGLRTLGSLASALVVALVLGACAQDAGRDLVTYYDQRGLFIVRLPADNEITVTPP